MAHACDDPSVYRPNEIRAFWRLAQETERLLRGPDDLASLAEIEEDLIARIQHTDQDGIFDRTVLLLNRVRDRLAQRVAPQDILRIELDGWQRAAVRKSVG